LCGVKVINLVDKIKGVYRIEVMYTTHMIHQYEFKIKNHSYPGNAIEILVNWLPAYAIPVIKDNLVITSKKALSEGLLSDIDGLVHDWWKAASDRRKASYEAMCTYRLDNPKNDKAESILIALMNCAVGIRHKEIEAYEKDSGTDSSYQVKCLNDIKVLYDKLNAGDYGDLVTAYFEIDEHITDLLPCFVRSLLDALEYGVK
jgi:hypothetical protein